jgi:hypothetical protein
MKKKELELLDSSIDILTSALEILKKNRGFYIYYNEPTKNIKNIKVHLDICGFCAWGSGRGVKLKESGRNGVWIGPFKNPEQAKLFAENTLMLDNISEHKCVKNNIKHFKK